ncbi:MAG: hypothetical protein BA865_15995 [Desulfobacterales bacterium S5133MH4]|nr:MAG: hypothetical protein BA865_15995 [Desulfobacterales bacterium S5133MH4]
MGFSCVPLSFQLARFIRARLTHKRVSDVFKFNCLSADSLSGDFPELFGPLQLKNYSKLITKTRNVLKANAAKYEDTKQDIEIKYWGWLPELRHIQASPTMKPSQLLTLFSCFPFFVLSCFRDNPFFS